ncbi:hypothetical protein N9299_03600 [Amylibacter sp.]|nr:hypothetical protein [Amylibacter sp.]
MSNHLSSLTKIPLRKFKVFGLLLIVPFFIGHFYHSARSIYYGVFDHLDWKILQYEISYFDFGFIRRGVIGSLLNPWFSVLEKSEKLLLIYAIEFVIISAFVLTFVSVVEQKSVKREVRKFYYLLMMLSPVGLSAWWFDIGRFDHINFLILFLVLHLIENKKFFIASMCCVVAIFIHEAFAFYGLILAVCFLHLNIRKGLDDVNQLIRISTFALPPIVAMAFLYMYGNVEDLSALSYLEQQYGSAYRVWDRKFIEPRFNFTIFSTVSTLILLSSIWILFINRALIKELNLYYVACLVGPLVLFLAGYDYARWISIVFFSSLIFHVYTQGKNKLSSKTHRYAYMLLILPLGPIGIGELFPYIHIIFRNLGLSII